MLRGTLDNVWEALPSALHGHEHMDSSPSGIGQATVTLAEAGPPAFPAGLLEALFRDDFDQICMTQAAYEEGRSFFASQQPEAACLLLGPTNADLITHIVIDDEGEATPVSFTLAAASLNRKVKPYLAAGLDIHGVWHLHPPGVTSLSFGDLEYARKLFANPKHQGLSRFVMPITASGHFYGFVLTRAGTVLGVRAARLVLV
jgi:hypothetical protein